MKEFIIKYKFSILLIVFIGTIVAFVAVKFQSCKNKVNTILTVPGYDTAYHKSFADSLKAVNSRFDSLERAYKAKFQIYDSTLMKSDIRLEVRKQVYNELRKYKLNLSNEEIYNRYKESLKDEE